MAGSTGMHVASSRRGPSTPRALLALAASLVLLAGCAAPPAPSGSLAPGATPSSSGPLAGGTGTGTGPGTDPGTAPGTGDAGASGGTPDPGGNATGDEEPGGNGWSTMRVDDAAAVATLVPTASGAAGVATTTAFRLTSLDGTDPATLASRLRVEPAVALQVASVEGAAVVLRPATALRERTAYRLTLLREDGSTAAGWAAQTAGALTVLGTIPGDAATGVPTDAGIELQFDQAGVTAADLASHLRIDPPVRGGYEVDGRIAAFGPAANLKPATVYTVTVTAGLALPGTGQRLEHAVVFRFETAPRDPKPAVVVAPLASLVESGTGSRAAIGLQVDVPEDENGDAQASRPAKVAVTVHALAGIGAAMDAWAAIERGPSWARSRTVPDVSTVGLPRLLSARLRVQGEDWKPWIELPRRLPAGWYLVTITVANRPRQAVLQVTDLAVYAMAATNRTAVWVNDLRTTRPVAGAVVTVGGVRLGATGSDGLLRARTPESVLALKATAEGSGPFSSFLLVRSAGRRAFHPIRAAWLCEACADGGDEQESWWHLLASDRTRYRSTDTINAWGVVRGRDTGRVPSKVTLELTAASALEPASTAIRTVTARPDATGAYAVSIPFEGVPSGGYTLRARVGGTQVDETWIDVGVLRKPAYRLAMSTAHRAMHAGTTMATTVHAAFFEGTPVAGTVLALGTEDAAGVSAATDADGDASADVPIGTPEGQWAVMEIGVHPSSPEEGEIGARAEVAVFRGSALVDTDATLDGTRLAITGRVSDVVLARFDEQPATDLWSVDPRGAGRAGVSVAVTVIERRSVRVRDGRTYDFVTKRMVTHYTWDERTRTVLSRTVRTASDGTFRLRADVAGPDRSYEVRAAYRDEGGHLLVAETYAAGSRVRDDADWARLTGPATSADDPFRVGDTVRVRYEGGLAQPRVNRYLFAVMQRGLRSVEVSSSRVFRTPFRASLVPGFTIRAVRFTGYGYEVADSFGARLRMATRRLAVTVTPDRSRYAPGDSATLLVRIRDPRGRPVAATAFVQVADEKLYAMGAAGTADPLEALYQPVGDGIVLTVRSHRTPMDLDGGKGDTGGADTGGGDTAGGGGEGGAARADFRDWLLGRLVTTDASGTARVTVPLSDDLTSWRATAAAVDHRLQAGVGQAPIVVAIPFFAEATIAPEYLASDRPIVRVRGFGGGLAAGQEVTFRVSSDTLPMDTVMVTAPAFKAAEVPLPALSVGTHTLRIEATAGSGDTAARDVLLRTFSVVAARATRAQTKWTPVDGVVPLAGDGVGMTRVTLVDAGRGRVVPVLEELATRELARGDAVIASNLAARVLKDAFGIERPTATGEDGLLAYLANENLVSIVAWGSGDLETTVLAALAGDPRLPDEAVRERFRAILGPDEADGKLLGRPQRILALAGLAGLGDPVLVDIRAAAAARDLTAGERATLAVAALAAGDENLARALEHDLLADRGRHRGPYTRVLASPDEDDSVVTAWVAIVAASLGEPVAAELDAWVADNPPATTLVDAQRALAARGWAARVAPAGGVVTLTVDDAARRLAVRDGDAISIELTPAQAASASLARESGALLAVITRDIPLVASSLTPVEDLTLERSVTPSGAIGSTSTVVVAITASLDVEAARAAGECWDVRDFLPSGLAPIEGLPSWLDDESGASRYVGAGPDLVDGQRIGFSVDLSRRRPSQTVRYLARVVTPGTYAWEPAVVQSCRVPDAGSATDAGTLTIRGAGG